MSLERQRALDEAITKVLAEYADHEMDRGVVTDWALVIEAIGDDGEPYLRLSHREGSMAWRRLGLYEYASQCLRSSIIANELRAED